MKKTRLIDRYVDLIKIEPQLSNHQAAERLGCNPKTLVSQIHRFRQKKLPGLPPAKPKPDFNDLDTSVMTTTSVRLEPWQRHRAVRHLAGGSRDLPGSGARDAAELADFLDACGLATAPLPELPGVVEVDAFREWCRQAYTAGRSLTWIANALDMSESGVRRTLDQAGVQLPDGAV